MSRTSSDLGTWTLFVLLAAIWGSSYLFIKVGLEEGMTPLTLVALRTVLGSALLAVVMRWQGGRLPRAPRTWLHLAVVGLTNITIPYALITWGELHISSGMAGILTAMVPLFTVALASLVLSDEPVTPTKVVGLVVGFGGVVVLASPSLGELGAGDGPMTLAGMLAVVLATMSYAVAAVHARRRLSGQPVMQAADGTLRPPTALEVAFGQVFVGMLAIVALALVFERPAVSMEAVMGSGVAAASMLWLGFFGTGVAFLLYFAIIDRWGATRATLIAYVMPIVAIVLGFLVLDERLRPVELVGAVLIISGVVLVNARVRWRARAGTVPVVGAVPLVDAVPSVGAVPVVDAAPGVGAVPVVEAEPAEKGPSTD